VSGAIPLIFGFTDLIEGRGFIARVRTNGRALAEKDAEDGGQTTWWVNGVNPGGVCARGETATEALQAFRLTVHEVLLDCAVRCETFIKFRNEIELIFKSTTEDLVSEWQEAALALRKGASAGPLDGLDRLPSDRCEYAVTVQEVEVEGAEPLHDGQPAFAQAA
jgi:hypothetical protein